jgi:uncharacterized membrane protein YcjF (UPF0283 family)
MATSKGSNTIRHCDKNIKEGSDDKVNNFVDDEEVETDSTRGEEKSDRRDEVVEVRKMSSKDTNRLRLWRVVMTGVLLLTAFAITFTTYTLLEQQEDENFKTAVRFILSLCHVTSTTLSMIFVFFSLQNDLPISHRFLLKP